MKLMKTAKKGGDKRMEGDENDIRFPEDDQSTYKAMFLGGAK
jgi:hypothetical protein